MDLMHYIYVHVPTGSSVSGLCKLYQSYNMNMHLNMQRPAAKTSTNLKLEQRVQRHARSNSGSNYCTSGIFELFPVQYKRAHIRTRLERHARTSISPTLPS